MKLKDFRNKVLNNPMEIEFSETIDIIDAYYIFTPTSFKNGGLNNAVGENSGSCKLFAFAKKQNLTKEETLACFGKYYFNDVLNDLNGTGHQNIRNFMKSGFLGLSFDGEALKEK